MLISEMLLFFFKSLQVKFCKIIAQDTGISRNFVSEISTGTLYSMLQYRNIALQYRNIAIINIVASLSQKSVNQYGVSATKVSLPCSFVGIYKDSTWRLPYLYSEDW